MTQPVSFQQFTASLRRVLAQASPGRPGRSSGPASTHGHADSEPGPDFAALAADLFSLQYEHNRAYQQFCRLRGITPRRVDHWTQIPAVPAAAFKELELTCLVRSEVVRTFRSSGTTGQERSRHFHSRDSLAMYEAALLPWFARHLLGDRGPALSLVILSPPSAQCPDSSLAHMFETIRRELKWHCCKGVGRITAAGTWGLDLELTVAALREAQQRGEPVLIVGTAFLFVHLLDELHRQNLRLPLPLGSRVMETGGYKGQSRVLSRSELHGGITDALGVPAEAIVTEYGMSELSSQAYDLEYQRAHTGTNPARHFSFPPWACAQVVSPETGREVREGETGLVRIFDLANVFSVMAVQTEDLGVRRGAGFELIGRASQAEPRGCSLLSLSNEPA